jgi:hypothetical protein
MDAAGEFPEVVIINPKVLIPVNENNLWTGTNQHK